MKIFLKIIGASIFLITAICLLACTTKISDFLERCKKYFHSMNFKRSKKNQSKIASMG